MRAAQGSEFSAVLLAISNIVRDIQFGSDVNCARHKICQCQAAQLNSGVG